MPARAACAPSTTRSDNQRVASPTLRKPPSPKRKGSIENRSLPAATSRSAKAGAELFHAIIASQVFSQTCMPEKATNVLTERVLAPVLPPVDHALGMLALVAEKAMPLAASSLSCDEVLLCPVV